MSNVTYFASNKCNVVFCPIQAENDDLMVCREQLSTFQLTHISGASAYKPSYAAALAKSVANGIAIGKTSAKRKSEADDGLLFDTIKRIYGDDEPALQSSHALCAVAVVGQSGHGMSLQHTVSVK